MSSCRNSPLAGVSIQFAHRPGKLASDILHISLVHSHLWEQLDLENQAVPLKLHNTTRAKDHQRFWQPVWINSFHMLITRAYKITETSTLVGRKKNLWSCVHWTVALLFICVHSLQTKVEWGFSYVFNTAPISFTFYTAILRYGKMFTDVEGIVDFSFDSNLHNCLFNEIKVKLMYSLFCEGTSWNPFKDVWKIPPACLGGPLTQPWD